MTKLILIPFLFISLQIFNQTIMTDSAISYRHNETMHNTKISDNNNLYDQLIKSENTTLSNELNSPIMLYDSIYDWKLNTLSGTWELDDKTTEIVYNQASKMVSSTVYNWEYGVWQKDMYIVSSYDSNNNPIFTKYLSWNGSSWHNYMMYTSEYDNSNNRIKQLFQIGIGSDWRNTNQYLYSYDSNNNLTSCIYQIWNDSTWDNDYRQEYSYNSNDDRLSELYQNWNANNWLNFRKNLTYYDSDNRISNILGLIWIGDNWHNSGQYLYYYEASGNLDTLIGQGWYDNIFVNSSLVSYTYDNDNNILNELNSVWHDSIWKVTSQYNKSYDLYDNLMNSTYQHLGYDSIWKNVYQTTLSYDNNSFRESYTNKKWSLDGSYISEADSSHYYFYVVVDTKEIESSFEESILVYPNPSNGLFRIKSKKPIDIIEVYDNKGIKVSTFRNRTYRGTIELDLTKYSSGYYYVVFKSKSETKIKTIIIK